MLKTLSRGQNILPSSGSSMDRILTRESWLALGLQDPTAFLFSFFFSPKSPTPSGVEALPARTQLSFQALTSSCVEAWGQGSR